MRDIILNTVGILLIAATALVAIPVGIDVVKAGDRLAGQGRERAAEGEQLATWAGRLER